MRKIHFLPIIFLLLNGCASIPVSVPYEKVNKINSIAVVSLLGEKINVKQLGTTVFSNVEKEYEVKEWRIDEYIENLVKNELRENDNLSVIDVNFDRDELFEIYKSKYRFPYADYDLKYVTNYLNETRTANHLDALILIAKTRTEIPGTPQFVYGYTLYSRFLLGRHVGTSFYLTSVIDIIDLHSLTPIARQILFFEEPLDRSFSKVNIAELTDDQIQYLKNKMFSTLDEKIPTYMKEFNLLK